MPQKSRNLTFISKECIALAVRLVNEPSGERPTVPRGTSLAAHVAFSLPRNGVSMASLLFSISYHMVFGEYPPRSRIEGQCDETPHSRKEP